jgi:uncharacterized protein (TIGR02594 family)
MFDFIRRMIGLGAANRTVVDAELLELLRRRALSDPNATGDALREYSDYLLRAREIELKTAEARKWINPIFVTVAAGLLTIGGNALLQSFNSAEQRESDSIKHQQSLFVEAFKAPTSEAALRNLQFLLDTGVLDKKRYAGLQAHIDKARVEGTGPIISAAPAARPAVECRVPNFAQQFEQQARAAGSWAWMEHALNENCVNEGGPEAHRNRIVEYLRSTNAFGADFALTPQMPWTTAFVVWALKQASLQTPVPDTAIAGPLANYGDALESPKFGCIVHIRRNTPATPELALVVGFYIGEDGNRVRMLMGNSADSVRISLFPKSYMADCRMPK